MFAISSGSRGVVMRTGEWREGLYKVSSLKSEVKETVEKVLELIWSPSQLETVSGQLISSTVLLEKEFMQIILALECMDFDSKILLTLYFQSPPFLLERLAWHVSCSLSLSLVSFINTSRGKLICNVNIYWKISSLYYITG